MKALTSLILLFLLSLTSNATNLWCQGSINGIYIDSAKDVIVNGSWRDNWARVCRTDGSIGNIDTVTCSLWTSLITNAINNDKSVIFHYTGLNSGTTCDQLLTYRDAPIPTYIMLKKD